MGMVSPESARKAKEQIHQSRIDRFDRIGSVVAQEIIDLLQSIRNVVALSPVDRFAQFFPGMRIVKGQGLFRPEGVGDPGKRGYRQG